MDTSPEHGYLNPPLTTVYEVNAEYSNVLSLSDQPVEIGDFTSKIGNSQVGYKMLQNTIFTPKSKKLLPVT